MGINLKVSNNLSGTKISPIFFIKFEFCVLNFYLLSRTNYSSSSVNSCGKIDSFLRNGSMKDTIPLFNFCDIS